MTNNSSGQTKREWNFTVERDIPIMAYTEEEAEKIFHKRYGNIPVLGIIRPCRYNSSSTTKNGEKDDE